jgi:GT2 family glycosyltransferase
MTDPESRTEARRHPGVEHHPHVAVVVLNWNGSADTLACVESLAASDWPKLTTIVVDNASEEDIEATVLARFDDAVFIRNSTNLGFAGGMNAGIRRALDLGVEYVLLLNNDTTVDSAMVRILVETAVSRPDAGLVSPLEFFRDAPEIVSSAGLRCDLRHAYQGPPLHMGERDRGQFSGVHEVDASSGTAMLVPAAVIDEVGLLDEALYLYIEDVDWAFRMRSAGKRMYVAHDARLWHGISASSGGEDSPTVVYYHARNSLVVCARHSPMRSLRAAMRNGEILFANLVSALRSKRPWQNVRAVFAGWWDYMRGRLGPRHENA